MAVVFPQQLYIAEFFNFDRFGEIVLTTERQFQPTALNEPGSSGAADLADFNERSRITLDDGRTNQNPDPAIHPNGLEFTLGNRFRGGDTVQNLEGVMHYAAGQYRVQPTDGADYTEVNARPASPPPVGGELEVAAFNVLNYFTTIDDSGPICGPLANLGCRGADDDDELARQRAKILAALADIEADIVGLIEIENDDDASVADLVAGLNDILGDGTYEFIATGFIGTDAIKQAFIYKSSSVTPLGSFAALDTTDFTDPNNTGSARNRPALAQTFQSNTDGAIFTTVVNHFKSKGSSCGDGDDDPEAGSCNVTRTLAAQVLLDWLATDPTGSGSDDVLIIGDLNAYDYEDPIDVLHNAGYVDLLLAYQGDFAYTYVFDGQLGYLDYALASPALVGEITGADAWHINADEPDILDYDTSFKQDAQDALYEPNAYRSSDHDPVIVGLDLNVAPVCTEAYASVDLLWPANHKFVALEVLGVTDADGDPLTYTIEAIFQDELVDDGGDGSTAPDGNIGEGNAFELRAERAGDGNGRVYYVDFTVDDGRGGTCTGEVWVGVPHDQGKNGEPPVDEGPLYDSTVEPVEESAVEGSVDTGEPEVAVIPEPTEEPKNKDKKDD
jgi:predicted extracellular nuclease